MKPLLYASTINFYTMNQLTQKQQELADLMQEISEDCYCAGWISGLEYALWSFVLYPSGPRNYGQRGVSLADIERLDKLSQEIGGWIHWLDSEEAPHQDWGEYFIPMDQWIEMYAKHTAM